MGWHVKCNCIASEGIFSHSAGLKVMKSTMPTRKVLSGLPHSQMKHVIRTSLCKKMLYQVMLKTYTIPPASQWQTLC